MTQSRLAKFGLLYPFITALFPALSLYVNNLHQVRFQDAQVVILILVIVTSVLWACIHLLVRDQHKSAIIATIVLLLLFSYAHVNNSVSYIFNSLGILDQTRHLLRGDQADVLWLSIWLLLLVLAVFVIYKYPKDLRFASKVILVCSIGALLSVAVNWVLRVNLHSADDIDKFVSTWVEDTQSKVIPTPSPTTNPLPDIYYIILDGLNSEETLKAHYLSDLQEFRTYLEENGFYIANQSKANYSSTELSLTSSLNFMYLDELSQLGSETSDTRPLEIMIEHNQLFEILHRFGYEIVTFSDEYALANISSADIFLSSQGWAFNAFQNEVINTTPLPALSRIFSLNTSFDQHRERVLFMYENLFSTQGYGTPKFVFAHFMVPHAPFVFGSNGEPVTQTSNFSLNVHPEEIGRENYISGYRNQVKFATSRLIPELNKILQLSNRPVIVVIQGDHGSGLFLEQGALEPIAIHERMSIFNAYFFFDQEYQLLTPDTGPVNTFRIILNQFFGAELPLLPNKSYFTQEYHPYDFIDVTSQLMLTYGN